MESKEIKLEYISTENMVADCLTKLVDKQVVNKTNSKLFGNQIQSVINLRKNVEIQLQNTLNDQ